MTMARTPQNPICTAMEAAFKKWYMETYSYPWITHSIGADRKNLNGIYTQMKAHCECQGIDTDNETMLDTFRMSLSAGKASGVWFMKDKDKFSLNVLNSNYKQVIGAIKSRTERKTSTTAKKFDFDE